MAARQKKTAVVRSIPGLNLRKSPALDAPIMGVLRDGEEIILDTAVAAPDGWKAVKGGGFVVAKYLE